MLSLSQIKQLSVDLTRARLNHRSEKIKNILQTLSDHKQQIRNKNIPQLCSTINKLTKHRDNEISTISTSLMVRWKGDNNNIKTIQPHNRNTNKNITSKCKKTKSIKENIINTSNSNNRNRNSSKPNIGEVYIASMSRGTKWPEIHDKNGNLVKRINVTSGSNNKINGVSAKTVSPMYLGPVNKETVFNPLGINNHKNDDEGALLFENYWQYGKIFRDLGHLDRNNKFTKQWIAFRKKGYSEKKGHRHPKGTKTNEVLYKYTKGNKEYNKYKYYIASTSYYFGEYMDYITSRKKVYCPVYEQLIKQTMFYQELKKEVCENGMNVMILDLDGPKGNSDDEKCLKVTQKMLQEKINDARYPFGHGYVFAAMIAGIQTSEYCQ